MHTLVPHGGFIQWPSTPLSPVLWGRSKLDGGWCQGTTCFLLQSCLGVLPTLTSDTFGISQTPIASQFWRRFKGLPIPSPFQQSPMLLHTPSIPTPRPTPPLKAAPRAPPPPKVTWRPLQILHPLIWSLVQHSLEILWPIVEIERLLWHPILRVELLK